MKLRFFGRFLFLFLAALEFFLSFALADLGLVPFGVRRRFNVSAHEFGVLLGEFTAEKENLRRIINPEQNDNQGARRAVGRSQRTFAEIHAEPNFADHKKYSCDKRA